jgi:hypothetical protein
MPLYGGSNSIMISGIITQETPLVLFDNTDKKKDGDKLESYLFFNFPPNRKRDQINGRFAQGTGPPHGRGWYRELSRRQKFYNLCQNRGSGPQGQE